MSHTTVTVTLPALGEHVTEATISRWLVAVGDAVDPGEPLLEVATDKVDTEIPSPRAGTVVGIFVEEDAVVQVGGSLVTLAVAATTHDDMPARNDPAPPAPPATASGPSTPQRLPRIRQIIAARMLESLRTSAQLTSVVEVDVADITNLRADLKDEFLDRTGTKLTFLPFFAKATIEALADHPVLGATVNADCTEITYSEGVDLGIAVDGPRGLMVPVIRRAHNLEIPSLATEIASLADQVRIGSIKPDALAGGTFTLTNTGSRGALFDTPILNAPQSGILGTGAVVERVVPRRDADGNLSIGVRSMVYLALTYDHRIVDGADAARFLSTVKQRLEGSFTAADVFAADSVER